MLYECDPSKNSDCKKSDCHKLGGICHLTSNILYAKENASMNIGQALDALKQGKKVRRGNWNGKNMWLLLQVPDAHSKMTLPYIYIEYPVGHPAYPNGSRVPWLASQTDLLAEDWEVVE